MDFSLLVMMAMMTRLQRLEDKPGVLPVVFPPTIFNDGRVFCLCFDVLLFLPAPLKKSPQPRCMHMVLG
jgi:hypothetical protein